MESLWTLVDRMWLLKITYLFIFGRVCNKIIKHRASRIRNDDDGAQKSVRYVTCARTGAQTNSTIETFQSVVIINEFEFPKRK